jgi:hypothetical protein
MHLLKNGHPAHQFTDEDRRKAAAVTNEIRREKRALFEQLRVNQEMEQMLARDAARRSGASRSSGAGARRRKPGIGSSAVTERRGKTQGSNPAGGHADQGV